MIKKSNLYEIVIDTYSGHWNVDEILFTMGEERVGDISNVPTNLRIIKEKRYMIHRLADCMNQNVPESTKIWQFCVVFPKCKIGENCNICSHCLIENDVEIGNNVTIKCGVQVWDGITLEDNVMIGSNVTFTNDMFPRSKNKDWTLLKTRVCKGATIGAGSVILPGIAIGENAFIAAGSVVTKDVPAGELWMGNPARFYREVDF